jgi:hypothetical protein
MPRSPSQQPIKQILSYTDIFKRKAVQMMLDGHSPQSSQERLGLPKTALLVSFRQACVECPFNLASVTGFIGTYVRLRHGWAEAAGVGTGSLAGGNAVRAVATEEGEGRANS